ncbi:MAG: hypothetical protein QXS54_00450 [Candidatus Methanomethylicaceae archaeon]
MSEVYNLAKMQAIMRCERKLSDIRSQIMRQICIFPGMRVAGRQLVHCPSPVDIAGNLRLIAQDLSILALVIDEQISILSGFRPGYVDTFIQNELKCKRILPGHESGLAVDIFIDMEHIILVSGIIIELIRDGYFKAIDSAFVHYGFIHLQKSEAPSSPLSVITKSDHNTCQVVAKGLFPGQRIVIGGGFDNEDAG